MNDLSGSAAEAALVPQQVLEDGEIILLTLKPSLWLIPLNCWPVALVAAAVATASMYLHPEGESLVLVLCVGAVALKTGLATLNWLSRLYVLTDRRVITLRGVFRCEVTHCPLSQVGEVRVVTTLDERMVGTGALVFVGGKQTQASWEYVPHPQRLRQQVLEYITRYRQ